MKPSSEEEQCCSSSYSASYMFQHGGGSMTSRQRGIGVDSGAPIGLNRRQQHRRQSATATTCVQRCFSRLTVLASLVSAVLLGAATATDRWIYITEPLRWPNQSYSVNDPALTITFRAGLWRTCATVNWTNISTTIRKSKNLNKNIF
ncbi:hypothetical protein CHUAL_002964 [Chamberlinius hualienensis]